MENIETHERKVFKYGLYILAAIIGFIIANKTLDGRKRVVEIDLVNVSKYCKNPQECNDFIQPVLQYDDISNNPDRIVWDYTIDKDSVVQHKTEIKNKTLTVGYILSEGDKIEAIYKFTNFLQILKGRYDAELYIDSKEDWALQVLKAYAATNTWL